MGLFISKVLVERRGRTFHFENRLDRGRVVYISLPPERLPTGKLMQVSEAKIWRHVGSDVI
jgi:hypothetical protein